MATDNSLAHSSAVNLAAALSTLVKEPDLADCMVICGIKTWKLHSNILSVRSPYFKTIIKNNIMEKLEMKFDIKDFDSETMDEIINYMYGKPIGNAPTNFLFEAAKRFQMDDLKKDVAKLAKQKVISFRDENDMDMEFQLASVDVGDVVLQVRAKMEIGFDYPLLNNYLLSTGKVWRIVNIGS